MKQLRSDITGLLSHMRPMFRGAAFLICIGASSSPVLPCGNGMLLFEEKFDKVPAWVPQNPQYSMSASNGALIVAENQSDTSWYFGPPNPYRNYEICVTVSAQAANTDEAAAGIVFFLFGSENYYRLLVNNITGTFAVERRMAGQWIIVIPWSVSSAIRKGPSAENEVAIKTAGTQATAIINDKPQADFNVPVIFVNERGESFVDLSFGGYQSAKPDYKFLFKNLQIRAVE